MINKEQNKFIQQSLEIIIEQKRMKTISLNINGDFSKDRIKEVMETYSLSMIELKDKQLPRIKQIDLPALARFGNDIVFLIGIDLKNKKSTIINNFDKEMIFLQELPNEVFIFTEEENVANYGIQSEIGWILDLIKLDLKEYFNMFYLSLFISFFMLLMPMYMLSIYDRIIPGEGYATLYAMTIAMITIILFDYIFKYVRNKKVIQVENNLSMRMETKFFDKLLKLNKQDDYKYTIGNKFNVYKDLNNIKSFFSSNTLVIFLEFPLFVIGMILMFVLSPTLTIVPVTVVFLLIIIVLIFRDKLNKVYDRAELKEQQKTNYLLEIITNKEDLINNNVIEKKINEAKRIMYEEKNFGTQLKTNQNNFNFVLQGLMQSSTIFLLFVGVLLVIKGELSVGYLIALSILISRIMSPVMQMAQNYLKYQETLKSIKIVNRFFDLNNEVETSGIINFKKLKGDLEFNNIDFKYDNHIIFKDLNLKIKENDKVTITGPVGVGKTTLMNLILGNLKPINGTITIANNDINNINKSQYLDNIMIMESYPKLYTGSVYTNIDMKGKYTPDELLEKFKTNPLLKPFSNIEGFLSKPVLERGLSLSDGEKRLVSLLRMVIEDKDIIIVEEPTVSMDPENKFLILNFLQEYSKDKTMILITHDVNEAQITNKIIHLKDGKVDRIDNIRKNIKK